MSVTVTPISVRSEIQAWVIAEVEGLSEVKVPELKARAAQHFAEQPGFFQRLATELLGEMVYESARRAIAASRGSAIIIGDTITDREGVAERATRLQRTWERWTEHAGDRHVVLMDMTRADLALAEQERRARGNTEHAYADLWHKLGAILEVGETVRARFTHDDIDAIYRQIIADQKGQS